MLTTNDLVETRGLIDVEDGDGSNVLGLVAAVDRSRGLALIQVPRAGKPVTLDTSPSRASGPSDRRSLDERNTSIGFEMKPSTAERPNFDDDGRRGSGPIMDGERLLGFRSEHGTDISLREIRTFLDEQDVVLMSKR